MADLETRSELAPDSQGAIGDVLGAIGRRDFELQPLLERIVERAAELCEAGWGYLWMRDGDEFQAVASHGASQASWEFEQQHPIKAGRSTLVGRVAVEGRAVLIPDVLDDPEYDWAEGQKLAGHRTALGVPVHGDGGELIGVIGLARTVVAPFDEEQIGLVSVFADQAAVAVRLAGLLAEEHEAAEREAAVQDVLQAIALSSFDLDAILQVVTEHAVRLCHAETGNLARRDGDVFRVVAFTGFDQNAAEYERMERSLAYVPERGSATGRVLLDRGVVHIPDVLDDPEYTLLEMQRVTGVRTIVSVPMLRDGEPIGVISLARNQPRPFTAAEIRVVQTFADQASIAVRLAGLLGETHEALERETAVGQVLQSISRSTFELDAVLQTVLDSAVRLTHADQGNILREADGYFRARAFSSDVPDEFRRIISGIAFQPERGSAMGRALLERGPVQIVDVLADPEYQLHDAQRVIGFRTLLATPLLRDGEPIGVLAVWRQEVQAFTAPEINLLTTFADQAVLAIENVRLFETIDRQRTELARYAPQAAQLLSSDEGEQLLAGHRREITALFCDLRGFTAFAETAEPEEVLGLLREYHAAVGELAVANGGTVEHFAGDGLMVFFNDPAKLADHQLAGVRAALAMRERFSPLAAGWRKRGYELGLGIGLAAGYATLGRIGFEGRYDYGAVGNVVILASRLSEAAVADEILVSQRLHAATESEIDAEAVDALQLKGFSRPMSVYRVRGLRS
jgi:two-component system NtrC family sensor kinase